MNNSESTPNSTYPVVKRILDGVCAAIALSLFSPLLLGIVALVKFTSFGPVFYRQRRVGKDGRLFWIYKFRTMMDGAEHIGPKTKTASHDARITPVGRYLRRYSLDELPQIFNILKGDMSFVGPRPVLEIHALYYDVMNPKRLALRPGITGLAQVSGRNTLDWPQKIALDLEYAEKMSFALDYRIGIKTLRWVLTGRGLYSGKYASDVDRHNTNMT